MMEFTVSRVAVMACGAMLLAAVMIPFTNVMDDREEEHYQTQCDNISAMIDAFSESRTEEMTISMNTVLPTNDSSLVLEGHIVKLRVGDKEYQAVVRCPVESDKVYVNNDVVRFVKEGNMIRTSCESDRDLLQRP